MDLKKALWISIVINIGLLVMIFVVKHNITAQAQDAVKKKQEIAAEDVRQAGEIFTNNNVLWELVMEIQNGSDKSLANVTRLAKAKRLPGRKDEKAFLIFETTKVNGQNARRIGWEKYSIVATFDDKENLAQLNVDDLLGKPEASAATP